MHWRIEKGRAPPFEIKVLKIYIRHIKNNVKPVLLLFIVLICNYVKSNYRIYSVAHKSLKLKKHKKTRRASMGWAPTKASPPGPAH